MLPCLWDWWVILVEHRTFSCNATCNPWNLAPWVRMCRWNFHTNTWMEPGNWPAGNSAGSRMGWVTCASLPTGGGNLTYIRKKCSVLIIPSHSPIWQQCGVTPQQNTKPTIPPPLCKHICLCTSHCKCVLRQRTFTHRTSTISGAAESCCVHNWFQQQDHWTYKGSRLLVITPLAMPEIKK